MIDVSVGDTILGTGADINGCLCEVTGFDYLGCPIVKVLEVREPASRYYGTPDQATLSLNRNCDWRRYAVLIDGDPILPRGSVDNMRTREGHPVRNIRYLGGERPWSADVEIAGVTLSLSYCKRGKFYPRYKLGVDLVLPS